MAQIPTGAGGVGKLSSQQGAVWEYRARQWLERKGLRFMAANVRERWGEIDLIMKHHHVIVFVEVRYRRTARFGDAAASVTQAKQHKLLQTARGWLARQSESFDTVDCRFDVLAFTGNEVEWIENAFSAH